MLLRRGRQHRGKKHRCPRERRHLKTLNATLLTAGALALGSQGIERSAWAFPSNAEMRSVGDAPVGIAAREFFDKSVWVLADEMLLQPHLDTQAHNNEPVHRGVEMELFAPGDFGVVLRYCW